MTSFADGVHYTMQPYPLDSEQNLCDPHSFFVSWPNSQNVVWAIPIMSGIYDTLAAEGDVKGPQATQPVKKDEI